MPSYVRNGFSSVRPYVFGSHNILDFLEGSLGGHVLARHQQGGNAQHIEVQIGDSIVVLEFHRRLSARSGTARVQPKQKSNRVRKPTRK